MSNGSSFDWDAIDREIDAAADRTDEKLASAISSVTRLNNEEIKELFPEPADVEKLNRLTKIVKQATNRNEKINNLVANIKDLAGTVITLLEKVG
ncbi:MAG: hypothetical protein WBC02_10050 [Candidatus Aminicenantaceae bacterium]